MKRILALTIALLTALALFSCRDGESYDAEAPSGEIIYKTAGEVELGLEILMPTEKRQKRSPAVIMLHGGGWISGSRDEMTRDFKPLCDELRNNGVTVIPVTYRLVGGEVSLRDCIDDCEDALSFIVSNAKKYGIDPDRIGIVGYSAGAQLAMMTAIESEDQIKYCVSMSGPTCFSDSRGSIYYSDSLNYYIGMIFSEGDKVAMYQSSPIIRLNRKCKAEFLLVNGTDDEVVKPAHAESFCREAESFGISAELIEPEGLTHSYSSWQGFNELCLQISQKLLSQLNSPDPSQ